MFEGLTHSAWWESSLNIGIMASQNSQGSFSTSASSCIEGTSEVDLDGTTPLDLSSPFNALLTIELLVDDLVNEEATTDELEDLSSEDEAEGEEEENRLLE